MRILGQGYYLPERAVMSEEVDFLSGVKKGTVLKKTGIVKRHYADFRDKETTSKMGKYAAERAMENAGMKKEEIDLIIGANATKEVLLPCSASLIQKQLGLENGKTACFDVGSSCLSFFTALEIAEMFLKTGKYKNILIVSSEIASIGINYGHIESAGLFGDGAAAFILGNNNKNLISKFQTFSEGFYYTRIQGGGTRYLTKDYNEQNKTDYLFHMEGTKAFKLIKQKIDRFFHEFLEENKVDMAEIDRVVAHQASMTGLKLIGKQLGIQEKLINIIAEYGNMIAASIPFTFAYGVEKGLIKRGDKILIAGTSAGISIGMMVLEY
jgi:3-oxoacyl-[acyl-carrier-protein] synthase-3